MKPTPVVTLLAALVVAACGKDDNPTPKPGAGDAHAENAPGERMALGEVKVGEHTISVFQLAKIEPGKEADFDLDFPAGKTLPGTVRGWIGIDSGIGSMKVRFGKETDSRMHGHPEVPNPIPPGSKLWLEIEDAGGTNTASVAYRQ